MRPAKPAGTVPATSPFTGKTLGRCKIGRPVGRGATATVFHAHYLPLKRSVAVKILRPDAASSPEAKAKFVEEARSLARLDHENVVRVFDVVEDEGLLLIIMDFVEGRSLKQVLDEDGALDPSEAAATARQVALALDHAHGARILHRDVKPGNIILREDGKAVLVDFGNAEDLGEAAGERRGTAHYVAPEVFQGKRQDEKTDTYSLGATLFHLLAGEPPYDGGTVQEILEAHEAGRLRAPSTANPGANIPKELDVLVKRSMASARGYRFAAKDMAAALEGVMAAIAEGPKRPRGRKPRARTGPVKASGPPPAVVLGGILVLAAAGVAAIAVMNREEKKPVVVAPPPVAKKEEAVAPDPEPEEKTPKGAGIANRAEARAAREAEAAKALKDAQEFAARNADKPRAVAERFDQVASEYMELSQGRIAREELRAWKEKVPPDGERKTVDDARAADRARAEKRTEDAKARLATALASLDFAGALSAHQDTEPGDRLDEHRRRTERLTNLGGFAELLGEGLKDAPVEAYRIRTGLGKPGETINGATAEGLRMKSPSGERTVPWSEAKAADVLAIGRKVLRNAPEPRLALACWAWENGLGDEARKEIDNAMLTDRTGTASARVQELFGDL